MPLDMSGVARALAPDQIQARLEGEYPNSRVLLEHRLPDVIDDVDDRHELRLVGSAPRPYPLTNPPWEDEAVNEVGRRLGRSPEGDNLTGARKGRVLYLLLSGAPVAFLTYHVPENGDIEVLGADSLLADGGYHQVEILLTAARNTDRAYFEKIARRHGFDDVAKRARGRGVPTYQLEARF